jgi:hypothetical protein
VDDLTWLGDDGSFDPQQVFNELTSPTALMRLVVQAIVDGNPSSAMVEDRVEQAMRALCGAKAKRGRRNLSSDVPILQRMAGELSAEPGFAESTEEWQESRRRTISRKFQEHRNRLLAEFASAHDMETRQALARVEAVLEALAGLGIRLNRTDLSELNP